MGPKLMNCLSPNRWVPRVWQKKRIEVLVGVPATEARNWRIEGRKRITRKKYQSLKWKVLWRKKGVWNLAFEKILRERGALPMEEGHAVREHKAMNEKQLEQLVKGRWERERGKKGES